MRRRGDVATDNVTPEDIGRDAAVVAAEAKLAELRRERAELEATIAEVEAARAIGGRDDVRAEAAALVSGVPIQGDARPDAEALRRRAVVLEHAVAMAGAAVGDARRVAGRRVVEALTPEHDAILQEIGDALTALVGALRREWELTDAIRAQGATPSWPRPFGGSFGILNALRVLDADRWRAFVTRHGARIQERG